MNTVDSIAHKEIGVLTAAECQVILLIRGMTFGRLEIAIQNGRPVIIERIREKIKLT